METKEWIFLSYPLNKATPAYGGGQALEIEKTKSIECGDSCNQIRFSMSNHLGTHVDFPNHFCADGRNLSHYRPSEFHFYKVQLLWLDCVKSELISAEKISSSLEKIDKSCELLLIRSGLGSLRGSRDYWENGTGLGQGVAECLRKALPQLRAVALDSISLTSFSHREIGRLVHKEFLCDKRPLLIFEDVNLEVLNQTSPTEVFAFPLQLEGADGSPCTVISR